MCSAQTLKQDLAFKQWGQLYFPFEDWRWWKAQGTAESALNQSARSWCGAIGVMQLMPQTAKELHINPFDEQANIQGGVHYDRQLWDMWNGIPSAADRRRYMFGSYNAGIGNVRKAWRLAGTSGWEKTAAKLPCVTGEHAKETSSYVDRIHRIYGSFE